MWLPLLVAWILFHLLVVPHGGFRLLLQAGGLLLFGLVALGCWALSAALL